MTLKCDLDLESPDLSLHSLVIGSAHLTERNIWVKFNENHSKGSGEMEWTHTEW